MTEDWIRSVDIDDLYETDQLAELVETSRHAPVFRNYDYVRTADDTVFLLHGDRQNNGELRGFPIYVSDEEGDRNIDGKAYRKQPLKDAVETDHAGIEPDPVERGVYRFPVELVQQRWSPYEDRDTVRDRLDDNEYRAYEQVASVLEAHGADHMLIGSQYLGAETADSDVDIVALLDDNRMRAIEDDLFAREDMDVENVSYSHTEAISRRRAGSAPSYKMDVFRNRREVPRPQIDGISVDLLSMQDRPLTSFFLPSVYEKGTDVRSLSATVTDAECGHCVPSVYEIDVSGRDKKGRDHVGRYDLISFLPTYRDSLEEGDRITVRGRWFEDEDTVYLSDTEQYGTSYLLKNSRLIRNDREPDRLSMSYTVESKR
ncbi:MAG: hypothetical protein MUP66_00895 [Candidatus Nanohaloarchaeota archaeon QJJ-5]|nr:hypothetical protein [Candidatus Nanohaloarchaeota archaeon QJJ-5]